MKKTNILLLLCASPFICASAYASAIVKNEVVLVNVSLNKTSYTASTKGNIGPTVAPQSVGSFILNTKATSPGSCNTETYDFSVKSSNGATELCTFKFKVEACHDNTFGIKFVHGEITNMKNSISSKTSFDACTATWKGVGKSHGAGYYDSGKAVITVKTYNIK